MPTSRSALQIPCGSALCSPTRRAACCGGHGLHGCRSARTLLYSQRFGRWVAHPTSPVGSVSVWRRGGFTPPFGEVNSPLRIQTETQPARLAVGECRTHLNTSPSVRTADAAIWTDVFRYNGRLDRAYGHPGIQPSKSIHPLAESGCSSESVGRPSGSAGETVAL